MASETMIIAWDIVITVQLSMKKQGRKRPLDTPKRMIERRESEGERKKGRRRDKEREVKGIERVKGSQF